MSGQKGVLSVSPAEDREELPFPLAGKSSYIPTLLAGEAQQSASTFSKPTPRDLLYHSVLQKRPAKR